VADVAAACGQTEIADHALIGDCETAALVDRNGTIDWLCWPRFDSDACFAALLGDRSHGFWRLAPAGAFTVSRRYRPGTLILETVFETQEGRVAVIDFMPRRDAASHIVRLVEGRAGRVAMRMDMALRFGYGRDIPWVSRIDAGLRAIAGPDMTIPLCPEPPGLAPSPDASDRSDRFVGEDRAILARSAGKERAPGPLRGGGGARPTARTAATARMTTAPGIAA
jgi:hypothetical protein